MIQEKPGIHLLDSQDVTGKLAKCGAFIPSDAITSTTYNVLPQDLFIRCARVWPLRCCDECLKKIS